MGSRGYARQQPSLTQRLVMRLMRSRAAAIERESREWLVICPNCGLERSLWDIGGVRYGARSRGKRLGVRCPTCGKRSMHPVEHRSAPQQRQGAARPSLDGCATGLRAHPFQHANLPQARPHTRKPERGRTP